MGGPHGRIPPWLERNGLCRGQKRRHNAGPTFSLIGCRPWQLISSARSKPACSFTPECSISRERLCRSWGRGMTNTRKILIVDDDSELREALVEQLALHEEFESIAVDNGTTGIQTAKAGQIDLVIMDVGLPDVDGREAVRILRKNGFKAPIIMLTGHNTDSDTILGLESGANDYVTKPFRFAVLLARIRA